MNEVHHQYGLIGFPLGHSFSKSYFNNKFEDLGLIFHHYESFELETIKHFVDLIKSHQNIRGLNVTTPYKESIVEFLDHLDAAAEQIGAVNTIKLSGQKLIGYNTDAIGFQETLEELNFDLKHALVLGTGGASKAIQYALAQLKFGFDLVSRNADKGDFTYENLPKEKLKHYDLIVQCSPVGTYPDSSKCLEFPFDALSNNHLVYDLIYNPEKTLFLKMLNLQALERSMGKPCSSLKQKQLGISGNLNDYDTSCRQEYYED